MSVTLPEGFVDEGEFAGYVDSGMWELEEWMAGYDRLRMHFLLSNEDLDDD